MAPFIRDLDGLKNVVREDWYRQTLQSLRNSIVSFDEQNEQVQTMCLLQALLYSDVEHFNDRPIPSLQGKSMLEGNYIVQVEECNNISFPFSTQYKEENVSSKNRTLKFSLFDGGTQLIAVEHHPINSISFPVPRGFKIFISGPIKIERGILLLTPENTHALGGLVHELEEQRLAMVEYLSQEPGYQRGNLLTFEQMHQNIIHKIFASNAQNTTRNGFDTPRNGQQQQQRGAAVLIDTPNAEKEMVQMHADAVDTALAPAITTNNNNNNNNRLRQPQSPRLLPPVIAPARPSSPPLSPPKHTTEEQEGEQQEDDTDEYGWGMNGGGHDHLHDDDHDDMPFNDDDHDDMPFNDAPMDENLHEHAEYIPCPDQRQDVIDLIDDNDDDDDNNNNNNNTNTNTNNGDDNMPTRPLLATTITTTTTDIHKKSMKDEDEIIDSQEQENPPLAISYQTASSTPTSGSKRRRDTASPPTISKKVTGNDNNHTNDGDDGVLPSKRKLSSSGKNNPGNQRHHSKKRLNDQFEQLPPSPITTTTPTTHTTTNTAAATIMTTRMATTTNDGDDTEKHHGNTTPPPPPLPENVGSLLLKGDSPGTIAADEAMMQLPVDISTIKKLSSKKSSFPSINGVQHRFSAANGTGINTGTASASGGEGEGSLSFQIWNDTKTNTAAATTAMISKQTHHKKNCVASIDAETSGSNSQPFLYLHDLRKDMNAPHSYPLRYTIEGSIANTTHDILTKDGMVSPPLEVIIQDGSNSEMTCILKEECFITEVNTAYNRDYPPLVSYDDLRNKMRDSAFAHEFRRIMVKTKRRLLSFYGRIELVAEKVNESPMIVRFIPENLSQSELEMFKKRVVDHE